jgi:hypothetical protein
VPPGALLRFLRLWACAAASSVRPTKSEHRTGQTAMKSPEGYAPVSLIRQWRREWVSAKHDLWQELLLLPKESGRDVQGYYLASSRMVQVCVQSRAVRLDALSGCVS